MFKEACAACSLVGELFFVALDTLKERVIRAEQEHVGLDQRHETSVSDQSGCPGIHQHEETELKDLEIHSADIGQARRY